MIGRDLSCTAVWGVRADCVPADDQSSTALAHAANYKGVPLGLKTEVVHGTSSCYCCFCKASNARGITVHADCPRPHLWSWLQGAQNRMDLVH
jgi:hypothetical protein